MPKKPPSPRKKLSILFEYMVIQSLKRLCINKIKEDKDEYGILAIHRQYSKSFLLQFFENDDIKISCHSRDYRYNPYYKSIINKLYDVGGILKTYGDENLLTFNFPCEIIKDYLNNFEISIVLDLIPCIPKSLIPNYFLNIITFICTNFPHEEYTKLIVDEFFNCGLIIKRNNFFINKREDIPQETSPQTYKRWIMTEIDDQYVVQKLLLEAARGNINLDIIDENNPIFVVCRHKRYDILNIILERTDYKITDDIIQRGFNSHQ